MSTMRKYAWTLCLARNRFWWTSDDPFLSNFNYCNIDISFNPRSAGGGGWNYRPTRILSKAKKTIADIVAKLSGYYLALIWRLQPKSQKISVEKFLRKRCFNGVMLSHFGSKSTKCLKASRIDKFEVKCNSKTPKDGKLSTLQNGYLGFYLGFLLVRELVGGITPPPSASTARSDWDPSAARVKENLKW